MENKKKKNRRFEFRYCQGENLGRRILGCWNLKNLGAEGERGPLKDFGTLKVNFEALKVDILGLLKPEWKILGRWSWKFQDFLWNLGIFDFYKKKKKKTDVLMGHFGAAGAEKFAPLKWKILGPPKRKFWSRWNWKIWGCWRWKIWGLKLKISRFSLKFRRFLKIFEKEQKTDVLNFVTLKVDKKFWAAEMEKFLKLKISRFSLEI